MKYLNVAVCLLSLIISHPAKVVLHASVIKIGFHQSVDKLLLLSESRGVPAKTAVGYMGV